jgi:colanic acid/amylovoran biosynthesis glycosyltransferase
VRIVNITHLVSTFPKISETFILNQLAGLLDEGHEIQVIARKQPDVAPDHEIIEEYALDERVSYVNPPSTYPEGLRLLGSAAPELLRRGFGVRSLLATFNYGKQTPVQLENRRKLYRHADGTDVFHAHFGTVGNDFLAAQRLFKQSLIVSFYGFDISRIPRSNPAAYDDLFREAEAITCLSEDMRDDLTDIDCPSEKIHEVPLSIDTDRFQYTERTIDSEESVQILSVARFTEKKGLQYAIEAISKLDTDRELQYVVAGDGDRREMLEEQIAELNVEGQVELLGWQSQEEVSQLMSESHLFLLPSVTASDGNKEGTPTVLLEAQATGLPVVSTTHAGIPEIVADGDAGLLVPERDADALADALSELIQTPDRWPEMGRAGREYVATTHSIPAVIERLIEVYESAG